jgi:hypothetical protein
MTSRAAPLIVAVACLCAAAPAPARQKPITGKVSKKGYTVIAIGSNGSAASSAKRSFRIVPKSSKVTLQLRDAAGRYAGPVVVGGSKSKVVVGVRAGAKLGTIRVHSGYATAHVAKRYLLRAWAAQARKGVPLGNGKNFGLVRSKKHGPAGDQDMDGVPDVLDIDANGNLILNNTDRSSHRRAHVAQDQPAPGPAQFSVFSQIGAPIDISLNANATGVSDAQIDALVQGGTTPPYQPLGTFLVFTGLPSGDVQLDCGGLSYCSPGGTGLTRAPGGPPDPSQAFPSCCDADNNGWGTMVGNPGPGGQEFDLYPKATSSQIKTGDTMIEHMSDGSELPGALNFVFNTTPALVSWTDTAGEAGKVTYPVAAGGPGTRQNPIAVSAGKDGLVQLTMTFWRPQRRAIAGAGEGDGFIDIGHLSWEARLVGNGPNSVVDCQNGLSTTDPNLTPTGDTNLASLTDGANDAPADPKNTLTYTLNFNACLDGTNNKGGLTFARGDTIQLEIVARSPVGGDNSAQQVYFTNAGPAAP